MPAPIDRTDSFRAQHACSRVVGYARFMGELLLPVLVVVFACTGCTLSLPERSAGITVVSWNVQNLFDDHADGNEYEEFDPNRSPWSTAEYYRRLEDVSRVIRDSAKGGPDVVALQEIEHAGVLDDLRGRFLGGLGYVDYCAAEPGGSPIVVGVLSKHPIIEARTHGVYTDDSIPIRPMLEVEIEIGSTPLVLIVCHWKSKSGGAEQTEPYRIASAEALDSVVGRRMAERPQLDLLIVGDLNERPDEYAQVRRAYSTALMVLQPESGGAVAVNTDHSPDHRGLLVGSVPDYTPARVEEDRAADGPRWYVSPWLSSDLPGSYSYRGSWERIDHALLTDTCFNRRGFEFAGFDTVSQPYQIYPDGAPVGYSMHSGSGFSDHLPIRVDLELLRR